MLLYLNCDKDEFDYIEWSQILDTENRHNICYLELKTTSCEEKPCMDVTL